MTETMSADFSILPDQRDLFEVPDGVTYLNCASKSPQLRRVPAVGLESVKAAKEPKIFPLSPITRTIMSRARGVSIWASFRILF